MNNKKLFVVIIMCALIAGIFLQAGFAEQTLHVYKLKPSLPEADTLLHTFFGADANKLNKQESDTQNPNRLVMRSDDAQYLLEMWPDKGHFELKRPSEIPTHYRAPGEGMVLPPPSKEPGKYTLQEAETLGREAFSMLLGISADTLVVTRVFEEDPAKEKSRSYRIHYSYQLDGLTMIPISQTDFSPAIEVWITDEGVVFFSGMSLAVVEESVSQEKLLTYEEMQKRNPWFGPYGDTKLSYYLKDDPSGVLTTQLVWYTYDDESWFSGQVFDAVTGKAITVD